MLNSRLQDGESAPFSENHILKSARSCWYLRAALQQKRRIRHSHEKTQRVVPRETEYAWRHSKSTQYHPVHLQIRTAPQRKHRKQAVVPMSASRAQAQHGECDGQLNRPALVPANSCPHGFGEAATSHKNKAKTQARTHSCKNRSCYTVRFNCGGRATSPSWEHLTFQIAPISEITGHNPSNSFVLQSACGQCTARLVFLCFIISVPRCNCGASEATLRLSCRKHRSDKLQLVAASAVGRLRQVQPCHEAGGPKSTSAYGTGSARSNFLKYAAPVSCAS